MTVRRRARHLAEKSLLTRDPRKFFSITQAGLAALGPSAAPPPRWIDTNRVSAAASREVLARHGLAQTTPEERARLGGLARARQMWGDRENEPERLAG
jgi:hypothetical protein